MSQTIVRAFWAWLILLTFTLATPGQIRSADAAKGDKIMVVISTSMGDMTVELNHEKAPATVDNFLAYVDSGHFDGTIFHRVIPGFMIQGGGFTADMKQKSTRQPIQNEADNGLKNQRGTLAMARTGDPHSATAQFFINLVDNSFLDYRGKSSQGWGYAVFATVVSGQEVLDKIAGVPTGTMGMHENVPRQPVTILSVKRKAE